MDYEAIIGLEVHVQGRTKSKMFCACPNEFGSTANKNTCPVCLGYPGTLPTPNQEAINKTVIAGMMINCDIQEYSKFDRKSFWYPDVPKNYQITQFDRPLCLGGYIEIEGKALSGKEVAPKKIRINRIHLEEDVGKSSHEGDASLIDYNRAGLPLLEIVSEADMRSADEAYLYLTGIRQIMQYAGVSDCDMEKGQMRCDVNISVREKGQAHFNTKTEIKNLNSFKAVHKSLLYEIKRQSESLDDGVCPTTWLQETRGWNDDRGETYVMRIKENSDDYRYFPCPDLMPVEISAEEMQAFRNNLPETPAMKRSKYADEFKLPEHDIKVLTLEKPVADFFEATVLGGADPKKASNWMMGEVLRALSENEQSIQDCALSPELLVKLIKLVDDSVVSGSGAKKVFREMFKTGDDPQKLAESMGLIQNNDIGEFVDQAIEANPKAVGEFKEGQQNALNFLLGQVMRFSKGSANPKAAREALIKKLSE